jgi:AraC family transcriptional regulator
MKKRLTRRTLVSYPIEIPTRPATADPSAVLVRPPCEAGRTQRTRLWESSLGLVEDLRNSLTLRNGSAEAYSPFFQICLPYRGLFVWHVGYDEVVADPNQVLFVAGGESFHLSQPVAGRYAELIITPDSDLLAELTQSSHLAGHPLFRRRSRRADLKLQGLRARYLHQALAGKLEGLAAEELLIDLLREAVHGEPLRAAPSARTQRLVRSTKEFLNARLSSPLRLRDVARAVGASPTYLTDVFRRVEGTPLHRYVMQLRLARALIELPHTSDLTTLAFSLGFSSHSHFTAAFRRAFGCTPSQFRESTRFTRTRHHRNQ